MIEPDYKTIRVQDAAATGARMRAIRLALPHQISLRAFAKKMGASVAFLSELERGKRNWTPHALSRFEAVIMRERGGRFDAGTSNCCGAIMGEMIPRPENAWPLVCLACGCETTPVPMLAA